MQARSALFDLYGDHLLSRGGWAPIAATVSLLGSLDIAPPAVRTAVSRMVREGWLEPAVHGHRGYAVTPRARRRLEEAHARIYRTGSAEWDGTWHLVVLPRITDRTTRAQVHRSLAYLGYGQLEPGTWVAPHRSADLDSALDLVEGHTSFAARLDGDPAQLARTVWDTAGLAAAYDRFLEEVREGAVRLTDEDAFAARSRLVHAWRLFLFTDPGLPAEVLPPDWPGTRAAAEFDAQQRALMPGASAWVQRCLERG